MDLNHKVAVVTGGSGAIGGAICRRLALAGMSVVAGFHSAAAAATALIQCLPAVDAGHAAIRMPVTDSAGLADMAQTVERRFGRCDLLVNCAGITRFVPHSDLDALDDFLIDQILATNVRGPFAAVRALRPLLARSGEGLVINISSIAAASAIGSNLMYCASKAALDNMTKSLARALAPDIRVLSVSPGLAETEFVKSLDVSWRDEQMARTPLKRLASSEEVADAALAAATLLRFTTGAIISVDGGRQLT